VRAFQQTSSAVEGRNGDLAQLHHNQHQRGLPQKRHKVWTVRHNFDCRALDGTTPATRFFGRGFPDFLRPSYPPFRPSTSRTLVRRASAPSGPRHRPSTASINRAARPSRRVRQHSTMPRPGYCSPVSVHGG
jgi:hypothetical protein